MTHTVKYIRISQDLKKILQDLQNYSQKGLLVTLLIDIKKNLFYDKSCVFSKGSTWHSKLRCSYLLSDVIKNTPSELSVLVGPLGVWWGLTWIKRQVSRRIEGNGHFYWGENWVKISLLFLTLESLDFESEHVFDSHGHVQSTADIILALTSF